MTLEAELKDRAKALGFDLAGIAPAAALAEASRYRDWVGQGMHGTMAYMEKDAATRSDIRRWHPQARSVLVLGTVYFKRPRAADPSREGRIASYALTRDYHKVLPKRLKALAAWVRQRTGKRAVQFVDTSPVLERLYARYAGVGWVGKNAMLISPRIGSYFFLSGLSLELDLAPDVPATDHCGTCARCLDACPTAAFPEPRVLDASRCVAYLNIEHRGPVPESLRAGVGNWVFGCDVCQEVCPFNRFTPESPAERLLDGAVSLEDAAGWSEADFRARMAPTPVTRAKWRGFLRNVLLAMGNSGNPRFVPALERFAAGADAELSEQAAWSLRRLGAPEAACV